MHGARWGSGEAILEDPWQSAVVVLAVRCVYKFISVGMRTSCGALNSDSVSKKEHKCGYKSGPVREGFYIHTEIVEEADLREKDMPRVVEGTKDNCIPQISATVVLCYDAATCSTRALVYRCQDPIDGGFCQVHDAALHFAR